MCRSVARCQAFVAAYFRSESLETSRKERKQRKTKMLSFSFGVFHSSKHGLRSCLIETEDFYKRSLQSNTIATKHRGIDRVLCLSPFRTYSSTTVVYCVTRTMASVGEPNPWWDAVRSIDNHDQRPMWQATKRSRETCCLPSRGQCTLNLNAVRDARVR